MPVPGPGPYSAESNIALTAGTQRVSMAVTGATSTYTVTGQSTYTISIFGMTSDVNLSVTTGGAGTVTCTYVSLAGMAPEECRVSGAAITDIVNVSVTAVGTDAGYVLLAK